MEKETKIYNFPVGEEKNDEVNINVLLDALYDLRLSLSIKRISGPTIKKDELREMLNTIKADKDEAVKNALDDVFEEYLGSPVKTEKQKYTIEDVDRIINEKVKYVQEKEIKDKTLQLQNNIDKAA